MGGGLALGSYTRNKEVLQGRVSCGHVKVFIKNQKSAIFLQTVVLTFPLPLLSVFTLDLKR